MRNQIVLACAAVMLAFASAGCMDSFRDGQDFDLHRCRWHNYYERGVRNLKSGRLAEADDDFKFAMRERMDDKSRALTYGTRIIDYFPHRERGVALYYLGENGRSTSHLKEAIRELEYSLRCEKSERAEAYLYKARAALKRLEGSG